MIIYKFHYNCNYVSEKKIRRHYFRATLRNSEDSWISDWCVAGSVSSTVEDSGNGGSLSDVVSADPSPAISMVSQHSNGTLNLWQLTFADHTKFSQVLSIGHSSRVSGHRFRVNDITCHPVLPLLLTTSHHNITDFPISPPTNITVEDHVNPSVKNKDIAAPVVSMCFFI
jgi:hypothetical protein